MEVPGPLVGPLNAAGTAVVGLIVGFVGQELVRRWRDAREERKALVRGIYTTVTGGTAFRGHDAAGGPVQRRLDLRQKGSRVFGEERGENDYVWSVEGKVSGEFVLGTYEQRSPATVVDRGAFHLQRDHRSPRDFQGLWVGWNPAVGTITHGAYSWKREHEASSDRPSEAPS